MQKLFYYAMMFFTIISCLAFLKTLTDGSPTSLTVYCLIISLISASISFMIEPRATKRQQNSSFIILMAVCIATVILVFSSCTTTGYGCHGRSKCMTRVQ